MNEARVDISVIVPTRNRPEWLKRCLDAIREQDHQAFEVIVVDDGSSVEVLQQYRNMILEFGSRFKLVEANRPDGRYSGPSYIRNLGVAQAKGEFVTFCDDDDYWCAPDHLSVALQALHASGAELYFANQQIMRGDTIVAQSTFRNVCATLAAEQKLVQYPVYEVRRKQILCFPDYGHLNITTVKRDLFERVGGLWEETRYAEDVDLFVRLCDRASAILFRPEVCSTHNAPTAHDRDSASKIVPNLNKRLLEGFVYEHLLATVDTPEAMRYAKLSLMSNNKVLSQELLSQNRNAAASVAARLAWAAKPGFKWSLYTLWLNLKTFLR